MPSTPIQRSGRSVNATTESTASSSRFVRDQPEVPATRGCFAHSTVADGKPSQATSMNSGTRRSSAAAHRVDHACGRGGRSRRWWAGARRRRGCGAGTARSGATTPSAGVGAVARAHPPHHRGAGLPRRDERGHVFGPVLEVGAHHDHAVTLRAVEATDDRRVRADVAGEPHDPQARLGRGQVGEHLHGRRGRVVVDHHPLPVEAEPVEGGGEPGVELGEVLGLVEHRGDHGEGAVMTGHDRSASPTAATTASWSTSVIVSNSGMITDRSCTASPAVRAPAARQVPSG